MTNLGKDVTITDITERALEKAKNRKRGIKMLNYKDLMNNVNTGIQNRQPSGLPVGVGTIKVAHRFQDCA